jgi:tetratricopeptide (TPR) repeat protein
MPAFLRRLIAAVDDNPVDVSLRLRVAGLLSERGYRDDAIAQCSAVLQLDPSNASALALMSRAIAPARPPAAASGQAPGPDTAPRLTERQRQQEKQQATAWPGTPPAADTRNDLPVPARPTLRLPTGELLTMDQVTARAAEKRAQLAEDEASCREQLRLDPGNAQMLLRLADVVLKQHRYIESAQIILEAATINVGIGAAATSLSLIWRFLRASMASWERSAPPSLVWDALGRAPAPVDEACGEFWRATLESRARVAVGLARLADIVGAAATSFGGELTEPGEIPRSRLAWPESTWDASYDRLDWSVLGLPEAPALAGSGDLRSAVWILQAAADGGERLVEQLRPGTSPGSGSYTAAFGGADLQKAASEIQAEVTALSPAYNACADALRELGATMEDARQKTSQAQREAERAIAQLRREHERYWDEKRQSALRSAGLALGRVSEVATRCAGAVRAAIPRGPAVGQGH